MGIHRSRGTVVVTMRGQLDARSSSMVERLLSDLVDGQGNLSVVVDLAHVTVAGTEALGVFRSVAEQARRRGATFALSPVPSAVRGALDRLGLSEVAG